ncbi:MAG: phospholipase D-like domain-containing protein [Methanimicrococcus sp.]|nr:phospholipase D-like domain-containing protein [Methanimicrococcus sp.]
MASIIDNKNKTMLDSLKNILKQAESVDILTAFFYFSGFNALADELKDKKIRILVGNTIEPDAIRELCDAVKDNTGISLDAYGTRNYAKYNNLQKKERYINSFIGLFNGSTLSEEFDGTESQKVFKMFLGKLNEGSLEIRLTSDINHAKAYILTNRQEHSCSGDQKGVVITGSSNFTYNGLLGQGEMNERFSDNVKYDEYMQQFEDLWNDSKAVDICIKDGNNEFVDELKKKLWIFAQPTPYSIFIRILYELYTLIDNNEVKNPSEISSGKFANLKYQIDAIKYGIDCINKNNGVIIADVVGLGKSIIASAIAHNLDISKTVIIAPPHLVDQWNEYQQDFGLRGARVYSSGRIEEVHNTYATDPNPILYIIDEAHRYRNELTDTYQYLHQLTRSNAENKVVLLTATPYNNRPQDLFALVKLFQTPSRSTINSVNNLSVRFRELIAKYNKLEKEGKHNLTETIKEELSKLSQELRLLIDPVIVRRSRIDLKEIKEYSEDLKHQNITFPEVVGPKLIEYDLGEIRNLYVSTLERLSNEFVCARYNPSAYLIDPEAFMNKYGELFEETDIQLFQRNLAMFIKRLLVMRFESSKAAFKKTLNSILASYENIKKWLARGYVPIQKRGYLPDPNEVEIDEILNEINNFDEPFDVEKIKKNPMLFSKELFKEDFITAIDNDIQLLSEIKKEWFVDDVMGFDPKYIEVRKQIDDLLKQDMTRKIVVFSYFADTAEYVQALLAQEGYRVLLYTGGATKGNRNTVRENFDASHKPAEQKDDYDIIVATDALSEGFNLNRAGIIINYDIPYNPTRVVQRIGRINRINKKMFDKIYIFNFFPTDIGEQNTLIKGISTLKMLLINNIIGSDTKTLTPDEALQSYFKKQYDAADSEAGEKSWDNEFKNIYNSIKHNMTLIDEVKKIPERARIVRKNSKKAVAISFAKRGNNSLFAIAEANSAVAEIIPAEVVLSLFKAEQDEKSYEFDDELDKKFTVLRDEIVRPHPKIKRDSRTGKAIDNLEQLQLLVPSEKDYLISLLEAIKTYDDLSDGELKYLAGLSVKKGNIKDIMDELKQRIPAHYINKIKEKVESIDAQTEIIMFTEDLRDDNE